jgi:PhnB protein
MARASTYLNFMGRTEEAFTSYVGVFAARVEGLVRFGEFEGIAPVPEDERDPVMHAEAAIMTGHVLQATDMLASMGHQLRVGNNTTIALEPDRAAEVDRLYAALVEGGSEGTGMSQMPYGNWGCTLDRFGVRWMVTYVGD